MMPHGRVILQNMLFVLKYLLGHPCLDCGETDPRVLDFDHTWPKRFTIGDALTRSNISQDLLASEMERCEIRCANCHRKKHCTKSYKTMTVAQLETEIASRPVGSNSNNRLPLKNRKTKGHLYSRSLGVPKGTQAEGCTDGPPSKDVSSACEQNYGTDNVVNAGRA